MSEVNNVGKGIGLCILAGITLMVLKLGGIIGWSWWWVTIPFWGPFALLILALLLIVILKLVSKALDWILRRL